MCVFFVVQGRRTELKRSCHRIVVMERTDSVDVIDHVTRRSKAPHVQWPGLGYRLNEKAVY